MRDIKELKLLANTNRKKIIEMIYRAKAGHPGGSLSIIDILTAIYESGFNNWTSWTRTIFRNWNGNCKEK